MNKKDVVMFHLYQPAAWTLWIITYMAGSLISWIGLLGGAVSAYYSGKEWVLSWATFWSVFQDFVLLWGILGCLQVVCLHRYKDRFSPWFLGWIAVGALGWSIFWTSLSFLDDLSSAPIVQCLFLVFIIVLLGGGLWQILRKVFPLLSQRTEWAWMLGHMSFALGLSLAGFYLPMFGVLLWYGLPGAIYGAITGYILDHALQSHPTELDRPHASDLTG